MKTKLTLLLSLVLVASAKAQVLPNDATVDGKTIPEWTEEWWKWIYSQPTNQLPLLDTDGSLAGNGQPGGPVFFLAGIAWTGQVSRAFSIREGSYLFFPVRYVALDNVDFPVPLSAEELRDTAAGVVALMTNLHAVIDGQPVDVTTHRVLSPVFSFNFESADNLDSFIEGHPVTGLVDPIVSDGYWIMLQPLPAGRHVIQFGGDIAAPYNSSKAITDIITILPPPIGQEVEELIVLVGQSSLQANRKRPLLASLQAAQVSFGSAELATGINQMRAFQHKLRAQVAPSSPELAEQFSGAAQRIMDEASRQITETSSTQ